MWNVNAAVIVVILSVVVHAKCVGETEDGFERKRYDLPVQTCMGNFDVHTDMIIRTKDSRMMGAKYLSEADVNGREECQKLCCDTDGCDVYIYEQKVPGSCYLFHCGSPEDFKCKFTQHRNYTSAILTLNNHLNELENQIKLTKHEEELNSLRKVSPGTTIPPVPTSTKVPDQLDPKINHSSRSPCSRNQFECRGSGECIAIYNTCDGIPQCSDGSDEAPELNCPAVSGGIRQKLGEQKYPESAGVQAGHNPVTEETHDQGKNSPPYKSVSGNTWSQSGFAAGYPPYDQAQKGDKTSDVTPNQQKMDPQQKLAYQARIYGREGEGLAQQYHSGAVPWQGYQMQHQDEGSHIFTHKGNGMVPERTDGQVAGPYGGDMSRSDYFKYPSSNGMNGNAYYNMGPVYYPNNLPLRQQQLHAPIMDELSQRNGLTMYGNGLSAAGPSDYYYEDPQFRGRIPVLQDPRISKNKDNGPVGQMLSKDAEKQTAFKTPSITNEFQSNKPKITESVKKILPNAPAPLPKDQTTGLSTTTKATTMTTSPGKSERPSHAMAAELKMNEGDVDGANDRPNGAILSLTLGMSITAIMIALVGCRLRVVRRRMRRSSKSPYAHDADFLVNGMYL